MTNPHLYLCRGANSYRIELPSGYRAFSQSFATKLAAQKYLSELGYEFIQSMTANSDWWSLAFKGGIL